MNEYKTIFSQVITNNQYDPLKPNVEWKGIGKTLRNHFTLELQKVFLCIDQLDQQLDENLIESKVTKK